MRLRRFAFVVGALTITVGRGRRSYVFSGSGPTHFLRRIVYYCVCTQRDVGKSRISFTELCFSKRCFVTAEFKIFISPADHPQFYTDLRPWLSATWHVGDLTRDHAALRNVFTTYTAATCETTSAHPYLLADNASRSPRDYGLLRSLPSTYNHCTRTRSLYTSRS